MIRVLAFLTTFAIVIVFISCSDGKYSDTAIIEKYPSIFSGLNSDDEWARYLSLTLVKEYVANYYSDGESMRISEAAMPYVFESLSFESAKIKGIAKSILNDYVGKSPDINDYIHKHLWEVDSEIRIAFIGILANNSDMDTIATRRHPYMLIDVASNDVDVNVRLRAIELIGEYKIRPHYCIYELVEMFREEGQSNEIRREILRTLGRYGEKADNRALDFLHEIANEGDEEMQSLAKEALDIIKG